MRPMMASALAIGMYTYPWGSATSWARDSWRNEDVTFAFVRDGSAGMRFPRGIQGYSMQSITTGMAWARIWCVHYSMHNAMAILLEYHTENLENSHQGPLGLTKRNLRCILRDASKQGDVRHEHCKNCGTVISPDFCMLCTAIAAGTHTATHHRLMRVMTSTQRSEKSARWDHTILTRLTVRDVKSPLSCASHMRQCGSISWTDRHATLFLPHRYWLCGVSIRECSYHPPMAFCARRQKWAVNSWNEVTWPKKKKKHTTFPALSIAPTNRTKLPARTVHISASWVGALKRRKDSRTRTLFPSFQFWHGVSQDRCEIA